MQDVRSRILAPAVRAVRDILVPSLPRIVPASAEVIRLDAGGGFKGPPNDEVTTLRIVTAPTVKENGERIARRAVSTVEAANAAQLERAIGFAVDPDLGRGDPQTTGKRVAEVLAIDPFGSEPWLETEQRKALRENIELITSIPEQYFDRLESDLDGWLRQGLTHEEVARRIEEGYLSPGGEESALGKASRRAELIAVDQIGKWHARLDELRNKDLGVEEYIWRTAQDERVRGPGGKYPRAVPSHRAREGKRFRWDTPPAEGKGDGHPGRPIRCFPASAHLHAVQGAEKLFRHRYDGELTEIVADNGRILRGTPNHPVLTRRGWAPLKTIEVGEDVFEASLQDPLLSKGHVDRGEASIGECFEALDQLLGREAKPGSPLQFHGDGSDSDVDVVHLDWPLPVARDPALLQGLSQKLLAWADLANPCRGPLESFLSRLLPAPAGAVRGTAKLLALFSGEAGHADAVRLALSSDLRAMLEQAAAHGAPTDAMLSAQRQLAGAGLVGRKDLVAREILTIHRLAIAAGRSHTPGAKELAQAIGVREPEFLADLGQPHPPFVKALRVVERRVAVDSFSGHVFNLQTACGWYAADGIVVHNCRCYAEPVLFEALQDLGRKPDFAADEEAMTSGPGARPRRPRQRPARPPRPPRPQQPAPAPAATRPATAAPAPAPTATSVAPTRPDFSSLADDLVLGEPQPVVPLPREPLPVSPSVRLSPSTDIAEAARLVERDALHPVASPTELRKGPVLVPDAQVTFERSDRARRQRHEVVVVDLDQLNRELARDPLAYVGPGGQGEIPGRVEGAKRFLERAKAEGIDVHMSEMTVGRGGFVETQDGRHRLEALRQLGVRHVPVSITPRHAEALRERVGVDATLVRPLGTEEIAERKKKEREARAVLRAEARRARKERQARAKQPQGGILDLLLTTITQRARAGTEEP